MKLYLKCQNQKKGEIYKLGKHYLMCGDSTDINDVEKFTEWCKSRFVFLTDPPI